jgi:glycosyltransferase involved in cell wall biosynthesis
MAKKRQGRKSGGRKPNTVGGKRPLLTAALMVKNEEEMLPRCLKSVRQLVDEIVVVDTGSTDRTVAIAEGFGARVYHHPWQDNFSLHRNQSIGYAKGEWFLIIDADEELQLNAGMTPERFYENLRTALKKAPEVVNVMLLGVKNVNRDGSIASSSQSARLFRAGTGVHYEGIVHNKAVYTGKVMPLNATILHYGYDLPPDAMARKYQRTASLLHRRLEENPDDIEAHFYLCQVYMHMGDADKAMPYGRRCLEMVARLDEGMDKSFYWTLYHSLAVCCLVAGRHDEARLWVARGLERLPHDVDLHYDLVQLALVAKDFPGLAAAAEKHLALACRHRQAPQATGTRFIYTAGPDYEQQVRYWLLTARVVLGEPERAREQWPMALPYLLKRPDKVTEYLGNLARNAADDLMAEHAAALARGFMEGGDVVRAAECCRFGLDAGVKQPEFLVTVLFLGRMMGNDALEADAATAYLEGLSSYDEMPSPVAAIMIDFLLGQGHERHAADLMGVLFSRYGLALPAADDPGMMNAVVAGCERLAAEFAAASPLAAATCKQLAARIAGGKGKLKGGPALLAREVSDASLPMSCPPTCRSVPKVSIGLPVYNGERYVAEAIEGILGQDFGDFELIISDNHSTDGTSEICAHYAGIDTRIRYFRQQENIGIGQNFFYVLGLASAPYFMWATYDDKHEKKFLGKCVPVLDADESVALVHSFTKLLNDKSELLRIYRDPVKADQENPVERYLNVIENLGLCNMFLGLFRARLLKKEDSWGKTMFNDTLLMAKLALHGKIIQLPEALFIRRFTRDYNYRSLDDRICQLIDIDDPALYNKGIFFPYCRLAYAHLDIINSTGLSDSAKDMLMNETIKCFKVRYGGHMQYEIDRAVKLIADDIYYWTWKNDKSMAKSFKDQFSVHSYYRLNNLLKNIHEAMLLYPDRADLMRCYNKCLSHCKYYDDNAPGAIGSS